MTKASSKPLLIGFVMADLGLILIALAGWDALSTKAQAVLYSAGGLLCSAGLVIIWIGMTQLTEAAQGIRETQKSNLR